MELWIRSTAKTNLIKAGFLTIMEGSNFYKKNEWESEGYTIANCNSNGKYGLLGTYKTKKRALEVLDEINEIKYYKYMAQLDWESFVNSILVPKSRKEQKLLLAMMNTYQMPED